MRCWRRFPVGDKGRSSPWISRPRWRGCPRGPERCSCYMTSKVTVTRRLPRCWASPREHPSLSYIGREWRSGSTWLAEGSDAMSDQWTDRLSEYLDDELPD